MKRELKRLALDEGAAAVGVASADRLGSVPSMDPNYLLPGARSIVSLMLPLEGDIVHRYLSKEDHDSLERHEVETYRELYRVGQRVASLLHSNGYRAVVAEPNLDYRYKETPEYTRAPYRAKQAIFDWFASESGWAVTAIPSMSIWVTGPGRWTRASSSSTTSTTPTSCGCSMNWG